MCHVKKSCIFTPACLRGNHKPSKQRQIPFLCIYLIKDGWKFPRPWTTLNLKWSHTPRINASLPLTIPFFFFLTWFWISDLRSKDALEFIDRSSMNLTKYDRISHAPALKLRDTASWEPLLLYHFSFILFKTYLLISHFVTNNSSQSTYSALR